MDGPTPAQATVLIVDDDTGLARLMEKAVRREGFATVNAASGEAAIAWLRGHPVDLMLLDMKLPDMTGVNVLSHLDKLERSVPFIVITGQGDERLAVEMMRCGALDYLVKDAQFLEFLPTVVSRALVQLNRQKRLEAAEQALKKQHAFSASVLEASGAIMLIADAGGRLVQWNRACEKTTGWSFGEMRGKSLWKLLRSPEEMQPTAGMTPEIIAGPGSREYEGSLLTQSGERRLITWSITTLRDQHGGVEFVIASGMDTTELHLQNEELIAGRTQIEELQKKYFRHFDLAPVGLIRLNDEGLILESNMLGAQMLGMNPVLPRDGARPFLAYVAPDSRAVFQRHLESALASGQMEMCELVLRSTVGLDTFVRMQSVLSRGGEETMDFYVTLTDLTERKHIEQELERQKALVEAAAASKELFFAMVSHELRTPLTPLLALVCDFAADPRFSAEERAAFAIMRRNLDLEIHLIDDLLDLTRVTSGKLELQFETTDLELCLSNAIEICRRDVIGKGLDLNVDLAAGSQFVNADASRLQQVFWNLMKNAIKFTAAPGGITITSRCDTPSQITVEFRDTGLGMDAGPLSHIFDPFFQVDPTLKQRVGGLGLGLAICNSITEAHGGTLTATSAGLGHGTTFRLVLPAIAAPAAASGTEPGKPAPDLRRQGLRLLLVEDHDDSRLVLARLLTRRGYQVKAASGLTEARALCAEGRFDLLITDLGLQGASGYEVFKELNARYGLPGIAMSGFGSEPDLARGKAAGFLDYLVKPVDAETLDAVIQRVTARFPG